MIYNDAKVVPVVLDNYNTAMTDHQDHPGTGYRLSGEIAARIGIEDILSAMGYAPVLIVDPLDVKAMQGAIQTALDAPGHAAIVTRRPCVLQNANSRSCPKAAAPSIGKPAAAANNA